MTSDTDIALQELYRDGLIEKTVRQLGRDADWQRFRFITSTAREARAQENKDYEENYAARVDKERQELIRKAGSKTFEYPTPMGTDRFSKDRIDRQAQLNVRNDHVNRLHAIVNEEVGHLEAFNADMRDRGRNKGMAREAFTQSTDRRTGQDRRGPTMD